MKISFTIFLLVLINSSFSQCEGFSQLLIGTDPLCFEYGDGSVTVDITGGTEPFEIEIKDDSGLLLNEFGEAETGFILMEGWYYSSVIDNEGCELYDSIYIDDPIPLSIESAIITNPSDIDECDGSIVIDGVLGDWDELTYSWSPDPEEISGVDANVFNNACAITYSLYVVNQNGCSTSSEFEVGFDLSMDSNIKSSIEVIILNNLEFKVLLPTISSNGIINLYNVAGRLIASYNVSSEETVLSRPSGDMLLYSIILQDNVVKTGHLSF